MNKLSAYLPCDGPDVDQMLVSHAPLVKRIAYHLAGRLPPDIQIDDLIQVGMIALLNAMNQYNPDAAASFSTYASIRVRGAMLDEVRRNEWMPRSVRQKLRQLKEVLGRLENRLGREATDYEIAQELSIDVETYHQLLQESQGQHLLDIDEISAGNNENIHHLVNEHSDPARIIEQEQSRQNLAKTIDGLPEREKLVLSLYYNEDLNLMEIGRILGVSESRACQIHSQAMLRLKTRIRNK
jgi:RNA polymerase sigma factor for flagellar operon FliA